MHGRIFIALIVIVTGSWTYCGVRVTGMNGYVTPIALCPIITIL